jgi:transcription-repair coupling factor (superfamily II helicase)
MAPCACRGRLRDARCNRRRVPQLFCMNVQLPASGQRLSLGTVPGSGDAYLIAQLASQAKPRRMLVVLCADASSSQRLAEEIPFFAPDLRVHLLPDWETLPYDQFSPHQDLVSERLATLHHVSRRECDVLLVAASTASYRLAPPSHLAAYTFFFKQGERLDEARLRSQLTLAGYQHVGQVMSPGEYSVRGGLIDLFPMGSVIPYRLDLLGDELETIRTFNIESQRSLYPVKEVRLLPGREFPMDDDARTAFRGRWRATFEGDPTKSPIYRDIGTGIPSAGIEYFLPLFFDETATLFDYLAEDAALIFVGNAEDALQRFGRDAEQRYRFVSADRERSALPPDRLFMTVEEFFTRAKDFGRVVLNANTKSSAAPAAATTLAVEDADSLTTEFSSIRPAPDVAVERRATDPLLSLKRYLDRAIGATVVVADSAGRRETILQFFAEFELKPDVFDSHADFVQSGSAFGLCIAPLQEGFVTIEPPIAYLSETELYKDSPAVRRRAGKRQQERASNVEMMVRDLSELRVGDPVVHAQHGIGRYLGLETMDLGDGGMEFLHLEYAHHTKLYVPVSQLHLISRYSGASEEDAPLHSLGSGQWDKARRKAAQQIRDSAAELLNLYARRAAREGHAFEYSLRDYETFAASFPFEETPDQAAAIEAVIADMTSGRPMDRLVCGDVGFGKTEVALRAAFVAVMGGKQVALLAPTTLLAEQHTQTFSDRFADWPVKIAEMSRFRSTKEVNAAIKGINDGTLDIVIGTHKLLSQDVRFARLGLIIIDEEHRFGVRHKERMKELRAEVDVLTLTATPIPRTLGMSLEGLREFSVIATAPQKRLAIKTFVRREADGTIREAVLRELKRGGQIYYLHNEVETIQNRKAALEALLPEARIAIAHGQMGERDLERVMRDFNQQRFNVLLCTTIIETGIDIPTANTIVIHRADKFGLAQLHQLRGRVGRSHHQAYAYLLVPDPEALSKQAQLRLDAIQQMEELGSGFYLAMHDLEIRGAGQVLGENQSGNMHEIGFQLYTEMLNEAVRALKQGREPDLSQPLAAVTEINLHSPALLPETYCGDVHERLSIYKRLATARNLEELIEIQEELIDRFGKLPEPAQALIETHRLRIVAEPLGIMKIDAHAESVMFQFRPNPPIDAGSIIALVQKNRSIKLSGQDKLRQTVDAPELQGRVAAIRSTLAALTP